MSSPGLVKVWAGKTGPWVGAIVIGAFVLGGIPSFAGAVPGEASLETPPVHVAYFIPSDRQAIPGYVERFDKIMTELQRFYARGMEAAGHGPRTFRLDRGADGRLRVHVARGRETMGAYGRNDSGKVLDEVRPVLRQAGLDAGRETVVIFELLLEWSGAQAVEVGPYCGGGDHLHGTAWVFDDERLDPARLGSQEPGGWFAGRACSIGEFNSHYIGGVAHELGHAFGLPHVAERAEEKARGHSLMGSGNHTYGEERRGQGAGTFLSPASAMQLARSRRFGATTPSGSTVATCRLRDLQARWERGKLLLAGRVVATPAVHGIVGYNDWGGIRDDYDALGWVAPLDSEGRFAFEVAELRPGAWQLRLLACHADGFTSRFAFDYRVDERGRPDLGVFGYSLPLKEAMAAHVVRHPERVEALTRELEQQPGLPDSVRRQAAHLRRLQHPASLKALSEVGAEVKTFCLTEARLSRESVGWGRPFRDQVLAEADGCLLQVGGQFFERGFYAHAPACHAVELAGGWKRLRAGYGLQDGREGSVVFVVRGDGRELFRSSLVKDHQPRNLEVSVADVRALELSVEDGGDGGRSDWGVWLEPQLAR